MHLCRRHVTSSDVEPSSHDFWAELLTNLRISEAKQPSFTRMMPCDNASPVVAATDVSQQSRQRAATDVAPSTNTPSLIHQSPSMPPTMLKAMGELTVRGSASSTGERDSPKMTKSATGNTLIATPPPSAGLPPVSAPSQTYAPSSALQSSVTPSEQRGSTASTTSTTTTTTAAVAGASATAFPRNTRNRQTFHGKTDYNKVNCSSVTCMRRLPITQTLSFALYKCGSIGEDIDLVNGEDEESEGEQAPAGQSIGNGQKGGFFLSKLTKLTRRYV
ncbi:hypothetical protein COOONC_01883 [Cooperia oncophora]